MLGASTAIFTGLLLPFCTIYLKKNPLNKNIFFFKILTYWQLCIIYFPKNQIKEFFQN